MLDVITCEDDPARSAEWYLRPEPPQTTPSPSQGARA